MTHVNVASAVVCNCLVIPPEGEWLEKSMTDVIYLVVGVAVLALFAGYAVLLRRA